MGDLSISLLFIQLFILVWSHTYTLGYSPLLLYCVAQIIPALVIGSSFSLFLCSFDIPQLFCMHMYVLLS